MSHLQRPESHKVFHNNWDWDIFSTTVFIPTSELLTQNMRISLFVYKQSIFFIIKTVLLMKISLYCNLLHIHPLLLLQLLYSARSKWWARAKKENITFFGVEKFSSSPSTEKIMLKWEVPYSSSSRTRFSEVLLHFSTRFFFPYLLVIFYMAYNIFSTIFFPSCKLATWPLQAFYFLFPSICEEAHMHSRWEHMAPPLVVHFYQIVGTFNIFYYHLVFFTFTSHPFFILQDRTTTLTHSVKSFVPLFPSSSLFTSLWNFHLCFPLLRHHLWKFVLCDSILKEKKYF